ncbi:trigger factor [Clostridium tetani]|uniref:trigger factor n=1 Tax=Clostridium tetani TaxID=1513 RepID=UPI00295477BB|nr:trigger factor [Clostridium tetani]BDR73597.1 trigger factor [Clostridium tetani]
MKVSMEKIENNVVKLEVTVEAKKFNEAMKKSYAKNVKKFNVPGFRKGKAPMSIIKRYYGETVFYEDAINICCDDTYPKALEKKEIKPVDYPQIDIVEIGEGKDFVYTAQVTVMPEVELGEYKGLEAKKVSYDVKDEDVENTLKEMQQRNARIQTKEDEEAIEKGNIAVIDFKGYVDEVPFEGGEGYDYSLEIGSGTFIDNFEDQLIGAKKGEEKEVKVKFPEEYGSEELNGKEAKFQVTIKEIKVKELPAIDDEFVKEVSEFDTLDELKEDIKAKIKEGNDKRAKAEYEEAVINLACENAKVDIPEVMVENEINNMLKDLEMKLRYQGIDLETYYQYTNSTEEKVREYMKEAATKRVKTDLVLAEVAKAEKLEATDEEIMDRAKEMAKQYGSGELEKTAKLLADSQNALLKADVINEKVVKLIVDNSKEIE